MEWKEMILWTIICLIGAIIFVIIGLKGCDSDLTIKKARFACIEKCIKNKASCFTECKEVCRGY